MQDTAAPGIQTDKTNPFLRFLETTGRWSAIAFESFAVLGIIVMIGATVVDVVGAKVFDKPIRAGTELVYFSQVIAIAGALAMTKITGFHIRMEFVDNLPRTAKSVIKVIVAILGLALFVILAWKGFQYAGALRASRDVTAAARVPLYPFVFWMALSCIPMCLVLLSDLVKSVIEVGKK